MFKGTSASAGIGIGKAVIVEEAELVITRNEVADAEAEIQRFKGALEKTIAATQKMADDLASRVGEKEAEIMQGHMMLLSDPMLTGEIENSVKNDKVNCEFAIENVCNMYADMFASMGDELMQQRATDMRDIKVRMQRTLMGLESVDVSLLPKGSILVAKDLTPSTVIFFSVHDSRHQSGKCFRYRNRAGRKNLTQRYFSKGTGDPGSSCSKWPDGCSKGRRQCSP